MCMLRAHAGAMRAACLPSAYRAFDPKDNDTSRGYAAAAHILDHARVDELIGIEEVALFFLLCICQKLL